MEPRILASAHKHGVKDVDILHAIEFPLRHYQLDESEVLVIGTDSRGAPLEIVIAEPEGDARVIHAMPLRPTFVRYLEGRSQP